MKFEFADPKLEAVYYDAEDSLGHGPVVDKGFRKVVGKIAAAKNEFVLRQLKGLHYHKLRGKRSHQHSLDLNDQWRLIVKRVKENGETGLLLVSVEDYH